VGTAGLVERRCVVVEVLTFDRSWPTPYARQSRPGCYRTVIRLLSDCYQTVIRMLSDCGQTVIRLLSDCYQTVIRLLSDCYQTVIRLLSDCYQNVGLLGGPLFARALPACLSP